MANGLGNIGFGQILGGATSLLSAIPTDIEKRRREIGLGQEDPAVAALRKRLAAQNAQTAMGVAQTQQGSNPALAARNAQQALAQSQIATNTELARQQMQSTRDAQAADPVGRRRDAGLQGAGEFLNLLGTTLGTQEAALSAADQDRPVGTSPDFGQILGGDTGLGGLLSPLQAQEGDDDGSPWTVPQQEQPQASEQVSMQEQTPLDLSFLDSDEFSGQPSDILEEPVQTRIPEVQTSAQAQLDNFERELTQGLSLPTGEGFIPQEAALAQAQQTVAPQLQLRPIPPATAQDPRNTALIRSYQEAVQAGDAETADAIYEILNLFQNLGF